MLNMYHRK